jgi:CHAD domain-containing protein
VPVNTNRIEKSFRQLRKILKRAPKRPSVKDVHRLRTHARRIEATFMAFGLAPKQREKRLIKDLGRIRRRAGKARDMDVLTGHTRTIRAEGDEQCLIQLLEFLGHERYRRANQLHAAMQKYGGDLQRQLKHSAARFEKLVADTGGSEKPDQSAASSPALADATAWALKLASDLTKPATLNRRNLHPYRLKVKQLRYVLQIADADNKDLVSKLGEVKAAIGEWHDFEELIAIASDVLDHRDNCKLMRELKDISRRKYDHALNVTNELRGQYLRGPGQRSSRRAAARTRTADRPAVQAAAAISA